jgi:predicted  nucleic acid-binding Zn-ribbon protein
VTLQEEVVYLRDEVVHLQDAVAHLQTENGELRRQLAVDEARIAELEQENEHASAKRTPSFVKANRPKRETVSARSEQHSTTILVVVRPRPASSDMPWIAARYAIIR